MSAGECGANPPGTAKADSTAAAVRRTRAVMQVP